METIADRVRNRMKALGIKQAKLAKRCGVEQPQLSRLLSGETQYPRYINELAIALQTTVNWLKTGEPEPVYGMKDSGIPYKPYPSDVGVKAQDVVAHDVNTDLNALLGLYRSSTGQVRKDFLAIIRHELNNGDATPTPKKNGSAT